MPIKFSPNLPPRRPLLNKQNKILDNLEPSQEVDVSKSISPLQEKGDKKFFDSQEASHNLNSVFFGDSYRKRNNLSHSRRLQVQDSNQIQVRPISLKIKKEKIKKYSAKKDLKLSPMQYHQFGAENITIEKSEAGSDHKSSMSNQKTVNVQSRVNGESFLTSQTKFGEDPSTKRSQAKPAKSLFADVDSTNMKPMQASPRDRFRINDKKSPSMKRKKRIRVITKNRNLKKIPKKPQKESNSMKAIPQFIHHDPHTMRKNTREEARLARSTFNIPTEPEVPMKQTRNILRQKKNPELASPTDQTKTENSVSDEEKQEVPKLQEVLKEPSNESIQVEESPKVKLGLKDTYQVDQDKTLTQELLEDFERLELQYKLKENWLDATDEVKKPFPADFSLIYTTEREEQVKKDQVHDE
eukprot:CAMPEP_0197001654 /NCGR_PEP_ID=MMETSP1380-20130617/6303_1 /TAXON_ID=5936 /ORGANISM="Euplotes crassus, Strain CT5" /LENGTH=411 /DNA_ID=CAMNT_0042419411 /DNA_START=427 /DNA_END=1665 /DNA_ORIENTATION=-